MRLWTMQPLTILDTILRDGVFRCDPALIPIPEFREAYEWLCGEMYARIGQPPEGVKYPVWAWFIFDGAHRKPDLRKERWNYGNGGEPFACIEIEVPDNEVLLSDFDAWSNILMDSLLSDTEEEDRTQDEFYLRLSPNEQYTYKQNNWRRVFDITPFDNGWIRRGEWVQATFWELKRDQVVEYRRFTTGKRKWKAKIAPFFFDFP